MAIPVIDFLKLSSKERAKTMAQIANGCEEWGFFQLVNHGIPEELLDKVKRVSTEFYKLEREENFNKSTPVKLLNESDGEKVENVDWEDVIVEGYGFERVNSVLLEVLHQESSSLECSTVLPLA